MPGQGERRRAGEGRRCQLGPGPGASHLRRQYEAAIIVSQDWDFGPAVRLAKEVAQAQGRRLVFESCFPVGPGSLSRRGVPGTTWVPIE